MCARSDTYIFGRFTKYFMISGKNSISFRLLQFAGGATCVGSHEHVLVLEDCKRFDQNSYQGQT